MRPKFRLLCLIAVACFMGWLCGETLCRFAPFRDAAGRLFGRGHLLAIANGAGLYEKDVGGQEVATLRDLIIAENLRRVASKTDVDSGQVDREVSLGGAEFGNEKAFARAVRAQSFSISFLRDKIGRQLRALQWLEKQATADTSPSEHECRNFYEAHREQFLQPVRFRASHIFLAAHAETPPEVVDTKQKAIEALAARLAHGEIFSQLVAEASEDEATKRGEGDLGFFSARRMPADFFAEIVKLKPGQNSNPFRSHLGFHIVRLTEIKPPRALSFEDVRTEISLAITNERRALVVDRLADSLGAAAYVRSH